MSFRCKEDNLLCITVHEGQSINKFMKQNVDFLLLSEGDFHFSGYVTKNYILDYCYNNMIVTDVIKI